MISQTPFAPVAGAGPGDPVSFALARLAALHRARRTGAALTSQSRSGANYYASATIRTEGARFIWVLVWVATPSGTSTIRPYLEHDQFSGYLGSFPGPGRTTAGQANTLWGLDQGLITTDVMHVTAPALLPETVRVGYSSSDTAANTCNVDYILGF